MASSPGDSELELISKLKSSSEIEGIYEEFSSYLSPLISSESSPIDPFIPLLTGCIDVLPNRILGLKPNEELLLPELLKVYLLCLELLDKKWDHTKPYLVYNARVRLISCYQHWSKFDEAEVECKRVLESIPSIKKNKRGAILPSIVDNHNRDLTKLIMEVGLSLMRALGCGGNSRPEKNFETVLKLAEEVGHLFRKLDSNSEKERLHNMLLTTLRECAYNLLGLLTFKNPNVVKSLCYKTIEVESRGVSEIASRMCLLLFSGKDHKLLLIRDILNCAEANCKGTEFVQLVGLCVEKFKHNNEENRIAPFCDGFREYLHQKARLYKQQDMAPISIILRLYAADLLIDKKSKYSHCEDYSRFKILLSALVHEEILSLIDSWHICHLFGSYTCRLSGCETFKTHHSLYTTALRNICLPLGNLVESIRDRLAIENNDDVSVMTMLFEAFYQENISSTSFIFEKDDDKSKRTQVLEATLAAVTLSIRNNEKFQETTQIIKNVIGCRGIKIEELQYMYRYFNSIFTTLRENRREKAGEVLILCCKSAWLLIKSHSGPLDDDITNFVKSTLMSSAALLGYLISIKDLETNNQLIDTIECWSVAKNKFAELPPPTPVVRRWVKEELRRCVEGVDHPTTLYSLLSSSMVSTANIVIILEKECTAYKEIKNDKGTSRKGKQLCEKMQAEITNIYWKEKHITKEKLFEKAKNLVTNAFGIDGIGGAKDCSIKYLSQAIRIMNEIICWKEKETTVNPIYDQLGVTYCLRALCTQEVEPHSKRILEDVQAALNIWLRADETELRASSNNLMVLLVNIVDLLHLKGFMELCNDAYKVFIKFFKSKMSREKLLTLLWDSKRLSHPLCTSPVNEEFIKNLETELGEPSTRIEFWIQNLGGNQSSSSLGFQHNFSFLFANCHLSSCEHHDSSGFQIDIAVETVREAALELDSNGRSILAGNLYCNLSERLIATGRLVEALSFAKQAFRLHSHLFNETFPKAKLTISKAKLTNSIAKQVFGSKLEDDYQSPWKVLLYFLESSLKVGLIYEMMGDRRWAEIYFTYGKIVSRSHGVPLFTFAFSYHLGRVYVKRRKEDSAEKEFLCAKKILDSGTAFCCQQCRLLFEACMYESLGDLQNTCNTGGEAAKFWYTQALEKLTFKSTNPLSFYEEGSDDAKCAASKTCSCSVKAGEDITKYVKSEVSDSPYMLNQKESVFSKISKLSCWHCLPPKAVKSGSVKDFINLKWEFHHRKRLMNLLTQLVKVSSGQIEVGEILVPNISLLVGPNSFCKNFSSTHLDLFSDLVVKDLPGDIFAIERAEVIYDTCWYSLKFYHSRFTSYIFCNLSSSFKFEHLASWLMVAFVLAREVPVLFEKVSLLLALMYVVSASHKQFSLSSVSGGLGEDNWSLYFHFNSLGPHFTSQLLSHLTDRCKVQSLAKVENSCLSIQWNPTYEFSPSFNYPPTLILLDRLIHIMECYL